MTKRIIFALLVIFTLSCFCPIQLPSLRAENAKTFVGTIKSFRPTFARPPKWPIARFTVVADTGEIIEIYVLGKDTVVTDIDGKTLENKRPKVGKKVEVKYLTGAHEIYGGQRYEAISMRYVPADYVSPSSIPAASTVQVSTAQMAQGPKVIIGTIDTVHSMSFHIPPGTTITVRTDKGENADIFLSRGLKIRDLKGYPVKKDKRVEINYFINQKGENEATSFRYVPADYVPEPSNATQEQTPVAGGPQGGNVFVGRIEKLTPVFSHADRSQPKCKILIVSDNGQQLEFYVNGLNPVIDANGKDISHTWNNVAELLKRGERLEVRYSLITNGNMYTNGKWQSDSARVVSEDYVPQATAPIPGQAVLTPAPPPAAASAAGNNIIVGKVIKGGVTFSLRCPSKFTIVTDNGETKDIWVPRDVNQITDTNGKVVDTGYPTKGRRIEIKYSIGDNGQYEAISMRYVT